MATPGMTTVSVPSYFREPTLDDLYYLFRQTHRGTPLTWETRKPISGRFSHEIIDDSPGGICDPSAGDIYVAPAQNGVAEAALIDNDAWIVKYAGDYYAKDVEVDGKKLTVRALRYDNLFADDFFVSLVDGDGREIARVDEDWQLVAGTDVDLVNAALAAVCDAQELPFNGFLNPIDPRTRAELTFTVCR